MPDGAHLGVSAGRALKTILGNEAQPRDDEKASPAEFEQRIRSRPLPFQPGPPAEDIEDGYSFGAEVIAHAFLVIVDDDPDILTREHVYTESDFRDSSDESTRKLLLGKRRELADILWDAMKVRWRGSQDAPYIDGASGFMVGWAANAVRAIKQLPPVGNPAIVTIGVEDDSGAE